jgi:small-conductance mechanosensitive channel
MNIDTILSESSNLFSGISLSNLTEKLIVIIPAVIIILVSFTLLHFIIGKSLKHKISEGRRQILKKVIRIAGYILAILYTFKILGVNLTPLLGAAGIAGIVIGFAAQTSVSNFISGFFLHSEKAFMPGDMIKIDNITGFVISIDFLAVKLRTPDNLFVRIPNETFIKNDLINITRYPIRRLDVTFSVEYGENLEKLREILLETAAENQYCLENPAPLFIVDSFGDSGFRILFALWFEKINFLTLKTSISIEIQKRFNAENIKLPHRKIDIALIGDKNE